MTYDQAQQLIALMHELVSAIQTIGVVFILYAVARIFWKR
jgi:hypothetical protein